MGKKKKGKGYIVLTVVMALTIAFTGLAAAEQEWLPGYGDKNGTLGKDKQSWRIGFINTICMEGTTSDTSEGCLRAVTLSADRFWNTPDASGTIALIESLGTAMSLTDAKVLIGASTGLAAEQSVSLINDVTGAMLNSGVINTTIPASTITSAMILDNSVTSGDILNGTIASIDILDATILNTDISTGGVNGANILDATIAAADIAANAVGASELNRIVNTLVIAAAAASNGIGNNVLYNSTHTLTPRNNANGNQFIVNSTFDVNGNVTVFLNGTADVDYTVEIVRWAP